MHKFFFISGMVLTMTFMNAPLAHAELGSTTLNPCSITDNSLRIGDCDRIEPLPPSIHYPSTETGIQTGAPIEKLNPFKCEDALALGLPCTDGLGGTTTQLDTL